MDVEKWKVFLSRTINLFFFQGCMKALGVIIEDTVSFVHAGVPLVGWSFTMMEGLSFLCAPVVSRLLALFSFRNVAVIGGFLTGAGFLCDAILSNSIYLLFLSNIITGCGFGLIFLPSMVALAKSFGSSFGTVLSISALVSNIGMVVLPPLLEHWREKYGLSGSVALLGALMWNQILCGILLPVKQKPAETLASNSVSEESSGPEQNDAEMSSRSSTSPPIPRQTNVIIAHPSLIFLYMAQFFHMIIIMAWAMFLFPYGASKGYPPSVAVLLSTLGGADVFTGRAVATFVFHWELMRSLFIILSPMLLLPFLFMVCVFAGDFLIVGLISVFVGICVGFLASWMFAFVKYSVCIQHFQTATAWSSTCIGVGVVLTGLLSGLIHNIRGSYTDVFAFLACLSVAQAVLTIPAMILANPKCTCARELQG